MDKLLYGDFEEQYTDYETAEIAILPVPYDGTSTWLKKEQTRDHVPYSKLRPTWNFYDIETDSEVYKHGIATLEPVTADSSPQAMAQEVEQRVEAILKDKKVPGVIGWGTLGQYRCFQGYSQILRYIFYPATGCSFGYAGRIRRFALQSCLCYGPGQRNTPSVVQVGIRSSAIEEKHNIDPDRIFYAHEIKESDDSTWMYEGVSKNSTIMCMSQSTGRIRPAYMPSTGTPNRRTDLPTVLTLLKLINERHNIVGLDVVELCPNDINKAPISWPQN